jgi:hypothetical protein
MSKENRPIVKVPKWWIQLIDNFRNRWKTFKVIEVEQYSNEWFEAEMRKVNPKGTICESHRIIYKHANALKDDPHKTIILEGVKRAYIQGQKMDNKLKEYKVFMND